jgi:hypothetical protein
MTKSIDISSEISPEINLELLKVSLSREIEENIMMCP